MLPPCKVVEPFTFFACLNYDKAVASLEDNNVQQGHVFFTHCILKHFVDIICPNNTFKQRLITLLSKYPMIDISAMGFVKNWQSQPLWNE